MIYLPPVMVGTFTRHWRKPRLWWGTYSNGEAWWGRQGWTSILVHNYGGRRRKSWKNDSIRDLLFKFPAHIVVLQEHAENFIGMDNLSEFHVCSGPDGSGLAILGRKSSISAVTLLDARVIKAKRNSCTPLMVAKVDLPHGTSLVICNVHFHHNTAKAFIPHQGVGHLEKYFEVLYSIAEVIVTHQAHLLIGDFNMAAPQMQEDLQELRIDLHAVQHHPTWKDCMCIFSAGPKPPGKDTEFKKWTWVDESEHRPLAMHFGLSPSRRARGRHARAQRGHDRWNAAKAKAKAKAQQLWW